MPQETTVVPAGAAEPSLLAADVGGTHARLGLVEHQPGCRMAIRSYRKYRCREYDSLEAIVRDFLDRHAHARPTRAAFACAGYVLDGELVSHNLPWDVPAGQLGQALALQDVALVNDFEAVAHATRYVDSDETLLLTEAPGPVPGQPQLVVGPGTGLGAAVLLPGQPKERVLATEAGQISLAPHDALESEVLGVFARDGKHVSCEHALSGPGLLNLYRAVCELRSATPEAVTPEDVTHAALHEGDASALQALQLFCALLGSFVGDLAMLYGASGGVWLAGGILPGIRDFLARSAFVERFLAKGRMHAVLEQVPVRLIEHGRLGVLGAAGWYLDRSDRASESTAQGGGIPAQAR